MKIAIILALPIECSNSSMLRSKSIITALVDAGHKVKCYCPVPDIDSKYYDGNSLPGVDIYRFKRKPYKENVTFRRKSLNASIKSFFKKYIRCIYSKIDVFGSTILYLPECKDISEDVANGQFDVLLSFSDPIPAHMIGKYCKDKNHNLNYVQQWGDPLTSDNISKTGLPVWVKKIIENHLIKSADRICYVSPFTYSEQKKLFPKQAKKMIFLPTPCLPYVEEKVCMDRISMGYFGSYNSVARNIKPFYEAAKRNPSAEFLIVGDSDLKLQSTANIKVMGRVSKDEIDKYMNQINVIVCLMNHKGNQIPGKLYHNASSNKDILLIKDGEYGDAIESFFNKYNHYTFVDNDVSSIDEAIKKYLSNGIPRRKPVTEFQAANVAEKLISGLVEEN